MKKKFKKVTVWFECDVLTKVDKEVAKIKKKDRLFNRSKQINIKCNQ